MQLLIMDVFNEDRWASTGRLQLDAMLNDAVSIEETVRGDQHFGTHRQRPTDTARPIRAKGKVNFTDGPFVETKEHVSG
jgi:hypothetical protein